MLELSSKNGLEGGQKPLSYWHLKPNCRTLWLETSKDEKWWPMFHSSWWGPRAIEVMSLELTKCKRGMGNGGERLDRELRPDRVRRKWGDREQDKTG